MKIKDYCSGIQHIGIPTNDIEKTKAFFKDLGFEIAYSTVNDGEKVAFLRIGNLTIETWQNGQAAMKWGSIDHISLDVKDVEELFHVVEKKGYKSLEGHVCSLPYWENGVKYFTIEGPNKEKIEFCEML
ncbi:glyoxalase family protein [Hallella bergensis DSM 17361]|uniref:Glyoxalase family protein n=1 Tax=Hallella bergensis DSM 17361 TaxID=585502 RepID=D1PWF0_9BACT|nr:VOC family protein [Hallella bergensis]EFA44281.1 glyoxalase family protein [Hallella bergensis DSM 17361]